MRTAPRWPALPAAFALLLAACSPIGSGGVTAASPTATVGDFAELAKQFDYDPRAPLDYRETAARDTGASSRLTEFSFASPKGGRAIGLLVVPTGTGPFAAALMMPGSNQPPSAFQADAIDLASRGAVAMVIDQSQTRAGHTPLFSFTSEERLEFIQTTIDLRRALDVLLARTDVDPKRIAYVGFSHGAFLGGLLSGVDHRVSSFLLKSGGGADYLSQNAPKAIADSRALTMYLDAIKSVDPNDFIAHAAPASVFLQNGSLDKTYSDAGVRAWQAAASEPKQLKSYPAEHLLNADATADGLDWLATRIGTRPATEVGFDGARGTLAQGTTSRPNSEPMYVSYVELSFAGGDQLKHATEAGFLVVRDGVQRVTREGGVARELRAGEAMLLDGARYLFEGVSQRSTSLFVSLRPAAARTQALPSGARVLYASADLPLTWTTPVGDFQDVLVMVVMAPGATLAAHKHGGVEPALMIDGSIDLLVAGKAPQRMKAGDADTVPPDTVVSAINAGAVPARFLVLLATPPGKAIQSAP